MVRAEALSASASDKVEDPCRRCGTGMAADQEWCLECGAARTLLRRPPDWRVPVALLVGLVALAALALVVTVLSLHS